MRLPAWAVAALRWSLRRPRAALALTALAIGAPLAGAGGLSASAISADDGPSPVELASRSWVSGPDERSGFRLDLVTFYPRNRADDDGYIVLWKRSSSELVERVRGGWDWQRGGRLWVRQRRPSDRNFEVGYVVKRCSVGAYDVCLDIQGLPEGPTRWYSNQKLRLPAEYVPKDP